MAERRSRFPRQTKAQDESVCGLSHIGRSHESLNQRQETSEHPDFAASQ
jgi:hypothetical protein